MLGRSATAAWQVASRRWLVVWAHRLWNQVGMLAQPVAGTFNLNDDSVVQKSVQQGRRDDWIAENFPPFAEAAIGGQDHRAPLVAGVDQLEEQIAGAGPDGEIADLIDDQQRRAAEEADAFAQAAFASALASQSMMSASGEK